MRKRFLKRLAVDVRALNERRGMAQNPPGKSTDRSFAITMLTHGMIRLSKRWTSIDNVRNEPDFYLWAQSEDTLLKLFNDAAGSVRDTKITVALDKAERSARSWELLRKEVVQAYHREMSALKHTLRLDVRPEGI